MSSRLVGTARVPGDKSIAHRALILAALARGPSRITGCPESRDVRATKDCLAALGTGLSAAGSAVRVEPVADWRRSLVLDAGNSGTTARLLAGALAGRGCPARLSGDASLRRRPMERVAEPLRALGASVATEGGRLPLDLEEAELHPASWRARVPSAQVKSAFLFAALGAAGTSVYDEPIATRDHGERLLAEFGARIERGAGGEWRLTGGEPLRGAEVRVAGDPSSAAVLVTAAVLSEGSELRVEDVDESPTRRGFVRVLQRMGAELAEEPGGTLVAFGSELRGVRVTVDEVPSLVDEVPLLALAAARAEGESVFEGLAELRHKESDRLAAIEELWTGLGVDFERAGDELRVRGGGPLRAARLDNRGDHRLAMLSAVLDVMGLGGDGPDEACVAVSWPGFYDELRALVR